MNIILVWDFLDFYNIFSSRKTLFSLFQFTNSKKLLNWFIGLLIREKTKIGLWYLDFLLTRS